MRGVKAFMLEEDWDMEVPSRILNLSRDWMFQSVLADDGMKMVLHCSLCACGHVHIKTVCVTKGGAGPQATQATAWGVKKISRVYFISWPGAQPSPAQLGLASGNELEAPEPNPRQSPRALVRSLVQEGRRRGPLAATAPAEDGR
jgi:hypothetical protein